MEKSAKNRGKARGEAMKKSKQDIDAKRAHTEIEKIIEKEGEPKNVDEEIAIFTRAWEKIGYKVKDARREALLCLAILDGDRPKAEVRETGVKRIQTLIRDAIDYLRDVGATDEEIAVVFISETIKILSSYSEKQRKDALRRIKEASRRGQ